MFPHVIAHFPASPRFCSHANVGQMCALLRCSRAQVVSLALLPSRSLLGTCTAHARRPGTVHLRRQPTTRAREELDAAFQAAVAAGN
jgi:hypothetical protein